MLKFKTLFAITALSALFAAPAFAETCTVQDPSDTPLNVRTKISGKVIGTVPNGKTVYISEYDYDNKGRPWVFIYDYRTDNSLGWVYRKYLKCY